MQRKLFLLTILGVLMMIPSVYAENFAVSISEISVVPATIYSGDTINVTVKFSASVPQSLFTNVKLSLFFDGELVDSNTTSYFSGDYQNTFSYTLNPNKNLNKQITVNAKIYDGGLVADEDSASKSIFINPKTGTHNLRIISITAPQSADSGKEFQATMDITNSGNMREDNVQATMAINRQIYTAPLFSMERGETARKTFTLVAPAAGTYDITSQLSNAYNSDSQKTSITVNSLFLSFVVSKPSANVNDWVGVSGYATRNGVLSIGSVNIYSDGIYAGTVSTTENGYYSTQVRFDRAGTHKITAIADSLKKDQPVYVTAPQGSLSAPAPVSAQPAPATGYSAVIIVTPDGQTIVYPSTMHPRGKYEGFSFVDIEASTKELDVVQYGGNTFRVTITNHLGRSGLFGVSADFNDKWAYLPKQEILEDGITKNFDIYFNPDEEGRFNGNIFISEGANIIKTIPLSVFVAAPPMPKEEQIPIFSISGITTASAGFTVIFFAVILAMYLALRKPRALEPLGFAGVSEEHKMPISETTKLKNEVPENPKAAISPFAALKAAQKKSGAWFFRVPWRNIIM